MLHHQAVIITLTSKRILLTLIFLRTRQLKFRVGFVYATGNISLIREIVDIIPKLWYIMVILWYNIRYFNITRKVHKKSHI